MALLGVLVPIAAGTGVAFLFTSHMPGSSLLEDVFIGTILTATSVSITVETLKELGKLSTKVGNIILAAAIIDDVLGLVALTIVTSLAGAQVNVFWVLLKILLFFAAAVLGGILIQKLVCSTQGNQKSASLSHPCLCDMLSVLFLRGRNFRRSRYHRRLCSRLDRSQHYQTGLYCCKISTGTIFVSYSHLFCQHRHQGGIA